MDSSLILIAETSYWLNPSTWWAIAQVVLGLGMVIFVHELGHFLVAKACGVKCEKFYVGFDVPIKIFGVQILPATLFKKQIGETEYGIGMIPFGGYVKMLGQDDNPANIQHEIERSQGDNPDDGKAEAAGYVDRSEMDPRSFRAKSVPQRMAIISAGVIFNLAFAVLFAALAFRFGVNYQPASVGPVIGGGPAWEENIADAKLYRVGKEEVGGDKYFTYIEMIQEIIFSADEGPVEFEIERRGSTEKEVVSLNARKGFNVRNPDLPMVGISSKQLPIVGADDMVPGTSAASASEKLQKGDRIIAVNDIKIESVADLRSALNLEAVKPVTLKIRREGESDPSETNIGQGDVVTSTVAANPVREVGFGIAWEPIEAIQKDSPAASAGIQVGDVLKTIDGKPVPNVLNFDMEIMHMFRSGKKTLEIEVDRGGEMVGLSISPRVPNSGTIQGSFPLIALDTFGVAVSVTDKVGDVSADRSDVASVKAGDQIVAVTYSLPEKWRDDENFKQLHEKKVELEDDKTHMAEVYSVIQTLPMGTEFTFDAKRGDSDVSFTVASTASDRLFIPKLGIPLMAEESFYRSKSWGDAFQNGMKQVWADGTRVFRFLTKLVTGKLSVTNLGGPGTIAVAATSEASKGTGRLLLFLTLLSANLAVVNFLPIPVLDGGHMMFLAYEGLFRRPVSQNVEILLTYAGLFFVLGLMIFVSFLDVGRISEMFD